MSRRLATIVTVALLAAPAGGARAEPAVREPLFELMIAIAEDDSLGAWDNAELRSWIEATGRPSRLPVAEIVRLSRRRPRAEEAPPLLDLAPAAVWELDFADDLRLPMPYSILGYHPGTLHISRRLTASEWRHGDRVLRISRGGETEEFAVTRLIVFRFESGHLVLDVDGWLDRLLGSRLDDSWSDGLLICRHEEQRRGLALGRNRSLRALVGEFDFRTDKVLPSGSALARGVGGFARPWASPRPEEPDRAWDGFR